MFRTLVVLLIAAALGFVAWARLGVELPERNPNRPAEVRGWNLTVAPPPRDPRMRGGPTHSVAGLVTRVTDDELSVRDVNGKSHDVRPGPWLGSKCLRGGYAYTFSDVRVGDRVSLGYDIDGGVALAHQLAIDRRPGGLIPPEPNTDPDHPHALHRIRQMHQDHEEKGTPYPPEYDPVRTAEAGRNARFVHAAMLAGWTPQGIGWVQDDLPIAPPPRPVRPLFDN